MVLLRGQLQKSLSVQPQATRSSVVSSQARKLVFSVLPFPTLLTWFPHVDNGFLEHQDSFARTILSNCKTCTVKSVRSTNCWRDAKNNYTNEPSSTVGKPCTICGFIHVLLLPNITVSSWKRYFAINGRAIYWKLKTGFQASHLLPERSTFKRLAEEDLGRWVAQCALQWSGLP